MLLNKTVTEGIMLVVCWIRVAGYRDHFGDFCEDEHEHSFCHKCRSDCHCHTAAVVAFRVHISLLQSQNQCVKNA